MQNKSLDSVKKIARNKSISRPKLVGPVVSSYTYSLPVFVPTKIRKFNFKFNWSPVVLLWNVLKQQFLKFSDLAYKQKSVPVMVAVVALLLAFGGGIWATWATNQSSADSEFPAQAGSVLLATEGSLGPDNSPPNQALFNMTITQLEEYFNQLAESNKRVKYEELLAQRKVKLKAYLEDKDSPFADIVDTIAELKHWKMVLAISNSESSLGKRCYNNNCSGIGVEPGHPLWRDYSSKRDWAKDLDKLIEKRYKDWTLEEMNGVYNKPGSSNWVSASTQILEEIGERGIQ